MRNIDDQDDRSVRAMPKPVPLTSVRLVYPLTDTETGQTRDVIVKKLVNTSFFHDRANSSTHWKRVIPGLNIIVPWPKQEPKEPKDNACDTLRVEVEARTFVPTLLRPPMPGSIIDELRNKYSKFRTRHDPEYIEARMQEDREAEAKKMQIEKMRTPLKDINRKERKLRRANDKGTLTPDMLERIGRVIAQKRQLILDAEGPSIAVAPVEA
jgi:large subunit ribosomal protein L24